MDDYLDEHSNKHHVKPKSRFKKGKDTDQDNIVNWDIDFHKAWHQCFRNMTVDEIKMFIDVVNKPNNSWSKEKLHKLRETLMMEV